MDRRTFFKTMGAAAALAVVPKAALALAAPLPFPGLADVAPLARGRYVAPIVSWTMGCKAEVIDVSDLSSGYAYRPVGNVARDVEIILLVDDAARADLPMPGDVVGVGWFEKHWHADGYPGFGTEPLGVWWPEGLTFRVVEVEGSAGVGLPMNVRIKMLEMA